MNTCRRPFAVVVWFLATTELWSVAAFSVSKVPRAMQNTQPRRLFSVETSLFISDNKNDTEEPPSDSEALQQELNNMMAGRGDGSTGTEDDDQDLELYNAAPLFTGVIVTIFSLVITGYGIYAGLTGDDPLTGHPSL